LDIASTYPELHDPVVRTIDPEALDLDVWTASNDADRSHHFVPEYQIRDRRVAATVEHCSNP
jgi:hypothetical protein